jgi:hypothetical protein
MSLGSASARRRARQVTTDDKPLDVAAKQRRVDVGALDSRPDKFLDSARVVVGRKVEPVAVSFLGSRDAGGRPVLERSPWRHRLTQDYLLIEGTERIVKDAALSLEAGGLITHSC